MNNDLEQFSEERLMAFINQPLSNGFTRGEQMQLARIALAAKQAKPVAWITWHQGCRAPDDCEDYLNAYTYKTEEKSVDGSDAFPVYTTPHPAHTDQVIPDGWKLVPVTPTDKMLLNAMIAGEIDSILPAISRAESIWEQFLAAAPKPESE